MSALRQQAIEALSRFTCPLFQGTALLFFHRVLPEEEKSPLSIPRDLEITPEFLDVILDLMRAEGYRFVGWDELLHAIEKTPGRRLCHVTFDDGYLDNLTYAKPVLERWNAPFSIYVTTAFIDDESRPWWYELQNLVMGLREFHDPGKAEGQGTPLPDRGARDALFRQLYRELKNLPPGHTTTQLERLREHNPTASAITNQRLFLNHEEIRSLAASGLAEIGSHTVSHPDLTALSIEETERELAESRRLLEAILGKPIEHLSYPFGQSNPAVEALAGRLGYRTATTTKFRMIRTRPPSLHAIPRLGFGGDVEEPRLVRRALRGLYPDCWQ